MLPDGIQTAVTQDRLRPSSLHRSSWKLLAFAVTAVLVCHVSVLTLASHQHLGTLLSDLLIALVLAIACLFVSASDIQWCAVGTFLLSPPSIRETPRQLLDVAIILLSVTLAVWVFVLSPVLAWAPGASPLLKAVGIMYLVGDLALVSALIVLVFGRWTGKLLMSPCPT
jgi:hypothetical protein